MHRTHVQLVVLLTVLVCAACAPGAEPLAAPTATDTAAPLAVATPSSDPASAVSTADADETITITFAASEEERPIFEPLIARFEAGNPGIRVQLVDIQQAATTITMPDGGEMTTIGPESIRKVLTLADTVTGIGPTPEAIANGWVRDLTPFIDADSTFERDDFYPHFLGKRAWKAVEGRLFHLKRALQKKGTKSAKRHLKRVRGKQARFRRNTDHILSKQIVASVEPGAAIVLENLTDIRKRTSVKRKTERSRRVHSWSFAQLKSFVAYKAEERGCTVVAVDPRHTSQACSCCGHAARNNRRSRGRFVCRACGYELHADLNAARNIAAKYHASVARRDTGGLMVNQPIVSSPTRSG